MKTFIGLKSVQFKQIENVTIPSLMPSFKSFDRSQMALYIFLMKLRTGHTNKQIACLFNLTPETISAWIRTVRNTVHEKWVPLHLYNIKREDLLKSTTQLSRKLYEVGENVAVVTWDATYVFTIKSSNYEFQKKSYSAQFQRNLVKFMLCVTTNGLIAAAYGPFHATKNDATIMNEILNEERSIFQILRNGDVLVVDRGFRDCISALRSRGFVVKVPMGTQSNQLERKDANVSRLATKTRFVVEVRNSHIKNIWKHLNGTKIHQSIIYLKKDFQICAALVNAFCRSIKSDENDWEEIADLMLSKVNRSNLLRSVVHRIPNNSFRSVTNLTLFPKLTYKELKNISQGSYQIRQAVSYAQLHVNANNNTFVINVCDVGVCQQMCGKLLESNSEPLH